jgi:RNA polymerase sigma factor (sigma-70 family)
MENNLGLVYKLVRRYFLNRPEHQQYEEDVRSLYCSRLPYFINRFDCKRGFKFSVYLTAAISPGIGRELYAIMNTVAVPPRSAHRISCQCLDMDLSDDRENTDADEQEFHASWCQEIAETLLGTLADRDREILVRRCGIGRDIEKLDHVGEELGISKERVRQLQDRALKRLRRPATDLLNSD